MMLDKEPLARGIVPVISRIYAQRASGRLDIVAGATEGALFFKEGKLVDARIGHLTGFQAINALAAMSDVRYRLDPAAAIPSSSLITSSERVVLRQFFGIETADETDYVTPAIADDLEEATVVTGNTTNVPAETFTPYRARPAARYLIAFAVGVLVVALVAAAVFLRSSFRQRTLPASVAVATEPNADQQPTTPAPDAETIARDLSGKWNVVNTVNTSAHEGYQNLQIGFAVSINQTGKTFTAKGQKVSENGRSLPAGSRTPIQLKGVIDGDTVEATFSEQGARRSTNGRFVWKLDRAGGLKGTFASTAAQSSGRSMATREL